MLPGARPPGSGVPASGFRAQRGGLGREPQFLPQLVPSCVKRGLRGHVVGHSGIHPSWRQKSGGLELHEPVSLREEDGLAGAAERVWEGGPEGWILTSR